MAIIKQAKNIKINVTKDYFIKAGKISEVSDKVNIESFKKNLNLISGRVVHQHGKDGGVVHSSYSPPELKIEESDYKLESTFALNQLFAFAKKDSMAMFCFWMTPIFGGDIPLDAYEKLYKESSDKKQSINPKITVAKDVPGLGASYYSGVDNKGNVIKGKNDKYKNHIIISQGFIDATFQNKEYQKILMIALVEEFGHHLDYLLRFEYSSVKGDAKGDEGAKFTSKINRKYKRYLIDPFENKEQHYATATIKGEEKKLAWDFADLHEKLKEFVDNRKEYDDNYFAGFEFFGAGMGDDLHGLGHEAIEKKALETIKRYQGPENKERKQIYFGNWLRDFSQFIDPMVIRPMANALDLKSEEYKKKNVNITNNEQLIQDIKCMMDENRVTKNDVRTYSLPTDVNFDMTSFEAQVKWEPTTFSPVKMSRQAVTTLVELIGLKEFGELKETPTDGKPQNYMKYLKDFRAQFAEITPELLGVYKPQEHIDNPYALRSKPGVQKDLNHQLDPDFVKDPVESQWQANKEFGTKNYIRGNGSEPFPSAFDCFIDFINKSNPNTVKGRINFGAAMHILEDYYAHSNFVELSVMKVYDPEVFPWDNLPATCEKGSLKDHKADISSNKHTKKSLLDRSRIKFKTLNNPELWTKSVENFMKGKDRTKVPPAQYYFDLGHTASYSENRGQYYSHAECAYVQTGSFGMLDTIASIAPKINNKIFSIKIEEQEEMKPGERTFNDALIYELLKDVSKAQAADTKEKNTNYKGTDDGKYADVFMKYLDFRDFMLTEPMKTLGKLMNAFGIFDYVTQYITVIKNTFYHFLALTAINLIDDYQTYLDNELTLLEQGNWKVNSYGPTHTQLAKDNGMQPLHHLAVELAESAVNEFGNLFAKNPFNNDNIEKMKKLAREVYFVHPMYTDWMDEKVIEWCNNNKNHVKLAREASVVLYGIKHGYQELAELHHQINIISQFNMDPSQQKEFNSAYAKLPDKWHKGWNRLVEQWENQGLETLKLKSAEESYKEALKDAGYGK